MNVKIIVAIVVSTILISVTVSSYKSDSLLTSSSELNIKLTRLTDEISNLKEFKMKTEDILTATQLKQDNMLQKLNEFIDNSSSNIYELKRKKQITDENITDFQTKLQSKPQSSPFENMTEESQVARALMSEQLLSEKFLSEPVDIQWSNNTYERFDMLFKDALLAENSEIESNSCRSTMCRVEISHTNIKAIGVFTDKLREKFKWKGSSEMSSYEENGQFKTVLILKR